MTRTQITAGTARNTGKTSKRRDLNSSREGSNRTDSSHSRYIRGKTTIGKNTSTAGPTAALVRDKWNSRGCQQQQGC